MTLKTKSILASALASLTLITPLATAGTADLSPRQQVVELLKSIETGDPAPAAVINPEQYIQHNLAVADGLAGFASLLQALPPGSARADTRRAFQDGDYVFTHTEYDFFGPKIGFDIFRFENGLIVEHWDNLQETPEHLNPSGRSMIDGATELTDLDKTEQNKALVRQFVSDVLIGQQYEKMASFFAGDHYLQHNPMIGDGLSGLGTALEALAKQDIRLEYDKIHLLLGEGNFVLAVSEGRFGGEHTAYYDLFRVADGKIVEHWDTIETIPPQAEWKNTNGKF
ncbi:nuclear transport factor 2 family protein [Neptuniibacter halophilus]|uniref:nuclear transport factor 2 family protein n=1 Tax=Neptuniibacter halophilus TaxID=651666 RepID=UPI002572BF38|nr:nuclear transport factor 2 family protein [Neptuniibacter halophilus]